MDLNAVRFDPSARAGHVESWFVKANDGAGERALWIKATLFASTQEPDRPIAEGWAIAFDRRGGVARHVAVKHGLRYEAATFGAAGLDVRWVCPGRAPSSTPSEPADELALGAGATRGRVSHRDHRIRWDLRFSADAPPLVPFPLEAMYRGPFPRSKTVTPAPDARFDGEVVVDGERWSVEGWRGMQGHNWGRGHAERYAWCHANQWDQSADGGADFVLEGFAAQLRLGPLTTPLTTLICVRHQGVAYDFNAPLDLARAHGDVGLRRFEFADANARARIEGTVEAATEDLVGLYYPNPDGPMTYCLNSKLARARVHFQPAGGEAVTLTSRAAALEIGTRDEAHGVRMYL